MKVCLVLLILGVDVCIEIWGVAYLEHLKNSNGKVEGSG